MKIRISIKSKALFLLGCGIALLAHAEEPCVQLPPSLQGTTVANIGKASELQAIDDQLETYLRRCMVDVKPQNNKAVCSNARLAAEQALRVIGRIDTAGRHNPVLADARLKSYKTATALLDRSKKLVADRICLQ
jgi:hypothetical protein